jgi:polysaccharide deacetylase 2 family uncharacterized protein YibQ
MALSEAWDRVRSWRPPDILTSGPLAAYGWVLVLVVACAAVVTDQLAFAPPAVESTAWAAQGGPSTLKLPQRPPPKIFFRTLSQRDQLGLVEVTADGQRLPRISPEGWMPWIAYARRYDPDGPPARVGLLMINLGADEALMQRAIDELPGEVSLAFLSGTPDLPRWMKRAHDHAHETYLMLPVEDPEGLAERGIRPIDVSADGPENVRRLQAAMARGRGYVGFVVPEPGPVPWPDRLARPLVKEIADRGLGLIEVNPAPSGSALYRLTVELGVGYGRSSTVIDYKLAGRGVGDNLDRLVEWTGEPHLERGARHDFGVLQPDAAAIDAIQAWKARLAKQAAVSFVPIIGHLECRALCMERLRAQPAQLRP